MDPSRHVDDEMRVLELLEKYRERLVERAKATMLSRPGERLVGLILDRAMPEAQFVLVAAPPAETTADPEVVGIVPRAFAVEFLAQFNLAASEFLPDDDRSGDLHQLPVIVAHGDGLQCAAVTFAA